MIMIEERSMAAEETWNDLAENGVVLISPWLAIYAYGASIASASLLSEFAKQ
jgi:hypothetical protein